MMQKTNRQNIHGWIVIDKPKNMGSTDVVNMTRHLLNARKNGHTGTLDPFATGVLPIAFGEATKLAPYVTDGTKIYEFTLRFGFDTTTDDLEGKAVHWGGRIPLQNEIQKVLPEFIGCIEQQPPAFSAIRINGQRAYKLAREGKDVETPKRQVEIYSLELIGKKSADSFRLRVECSKGTYVRSLGRDIALKLNTYGHLTELRRTKCSNFSLSDTILLENLKNMVYEGKQQDSLLPMETALRDIAALAVSAEDAAKLRFGQAVSVQAYDVSKNIGQTLAAFDNSCLVALVRIDEDKIAPIRVFNYDNK